MDWMRTKNCFRLSSLFLFQLFSSFAALSPALNQSDLQLLLNLDFMLERLVQKGRGVGQRRVCWHVGVLIRSGPKSFTWQYRRTTMHGVDFFSRVMLGCCTLQLLALSLEKSYLCSAFLLQNYSKLGLKLFLSKSGSEIFTWARK